MTKELERYPHDLAPPNSTDRETTDKLAALGYLTASSRPSATLPDPKSQTAALSGIEDAMRDLAEGRNTQAVKTLQTLLAANPDMADMWAYLGNALRGLHRDAEAAQALDRALELSGGLASPALAAAEAHLTLGQLDEARQRAELALKGNAKAAYDLLVRIALAGRDTPRAVELMRRAVDESAASDVLRLRYAERLAGQGDASQALAVLRPMATSSDPTVICTIGAALSDVGRNEEAEAALGALLARDDTNSRAHQLLGMVMLRTGRTAMATDELRRAVALDGKSAVAWNTLGVALYQIGDAPGALGAWTRSIGLDQGQYEALFNLGLVSAGAGRRDEAARALRRFVATAPPARFADDVAKARALLRELGGGGA